MVSILIIDDDESIRTMLRTALEDQGYEVREAADGQDGLRQYRENPADLIILDIFMPEISGFEVMLELESEFSDVKIIAISGGAQMGLEPEDFLKMLSRLGALQTSPKPLPLTKMIEAVQELVGAPS